jgi:excisionase family DNA binding protein
MPCSGLEPDRLIVDRLILPAGLSVLSGWFEARFADQAASSAVDVLGITPLAYTWETPSAMTETAAPASPESLPGRILTLDEVAELVQLSARTVYRAILAGDLDASQLTQRRGGWRIYESAVADWMRKRSNRARPPRPLADVRPVQAEDARTMANAAFPISGRLTVGPHMGRRVA